jgi:hypothetical protein
LGRLLEGRCVEDPPVLGDVATTAGAEALAAGATDAGGGAFVVGATDR